MDHNPLDIYPEAYILPIMMEEAHKELRQIRQALLQRKMMIEAQRDLYLLQKYICAELAKGFNPDQPRDDHGRCTSDGGSDVGPGMSAGDPTQDAGNGNPATGPYLTPGGVNYNDKIQDQMLKRGWTSEQIDDAQQYGDRIDAVNRINGEPFTPATRYVNPDTGASVVIDNSTNEAIQVGAPDFVHGVESGDAPGAVMRSSPNVSPTTISEPSIPAAEDGGSGGGFGRGGGGLTDRLDEIVHPGPHLGPEMPEE